MVVDPDLAIENALSAEHGDLRVRFAKLRDHPIALIMDFEDESALESYQVHPEHQRFVAEIVGPLQDDKKVYDYRC